MKTPRFFSIWLPVALALGCVAVFTVARAASTNVKAKAGAAATNSAPVTLPIPLSVFDPTVKPTKNPFFPLSLRAPVTQASSNAAPSISSSSFTLMGLSGSSDERLALINHRTFAVGEANEITTTSGQKVLVRLLQFKDNSVVIRVVTPPQPDLIELTMSKRAQ